MIADELVGTGCRVNGFSKHFWPLVEFPMSHLRVDECADVTWSLSYI